MHPEFHLFFWACLPGHGVGRTLGGLRALSQDTLNRGGRHQKFQPPVPPEWAPTGYAQL